MWRRLRDDFLRHVDYHVIAMLVLILPFIAVTFGLALQQHPAASTMQSSMLFVLLMAALHVWPLLVPFGYIVSKTFDRVSLQGRSGARFFLWNAALVVLLSSVMAGLFLLIHAL